jgi:hypothetical protein
MLGGPLPYSAARRGATMPPADRHERAACAHRREGLRIEMIDSGGRSELVRALLICDQHGVSWKMLPSEPVSRLLALVGVGLFHSGQTSMEAC